MDALPIAGFKEHPHTADWALDVWAPDLPGLLTQAALGMSALMGLRTRSGPRAERVFELTYVDAESLLVGFLSELLYLINHDGLGFDRFELRIGEGALQASVSGRPIEYLAKEIKAVTYHDLRVTATDRGLAATIVFDV